MSGTTAAARAASTVADAGVARATGRRCCPRSGSPARSTSTATRSTRQLVLPSRAGLGAHARPSAQIATVAIIPSPSLSVATDELQVQILHPAAVPPAHARWSTFDLRCVEGFALAPGQRPWCQPAVAVALPDGHAGLVVPRSGLAARYGISVVNGPGLIDPSYRGEIRVVLVNLGGEPYQGDPGDRIAQLLLVPFSAPAREWSTSCRSPPTGAAPTARLLRSLVGAAAVA